MSRDSEAVTPEGFTWDRLANRAGGKQSDGIVGVSLNYILSPDFLKGDGGIANVVWADSRLLKRISHRLLPGQKVATENDAKDLAELRRFLGR
jgi:acetyl-CoA decarbonylase/synthase complex subunit beta